MPSLRRVALLTLTLCFAATSAVAGHHDAGEKAGEKAAAGAAGKAEAAKPMKPKVPPQPNPLGGLPMTYTRADLDAITAFSPVVAYSGRG